LVKRRKIYIYTKKKKSKVKNGRSRPSWREIEKEIVGNIAVYIISLMYCEYN
tara:strand:- start:234 stop:389 length:156 start_codon:yes stop_codon:yes gene_type:complete